MDETRPKDRCPGKELYDRVIARYSSFDHEYFDLVYSDAEGNQTWLDHSKPLYKLSRSQAPDNATLHFVFAVKFYDPYPSSFGNDLTRFFFAQQVKRDFFQGYLYGNRSTSVLLAAFIVQSEFGDYNESECRSYAYLKKHHMLRTAPDSYLMRVMELHQSLVGLSKAEADYRLLETARKVELFGIRLRPAKDSSNQVIYMGVNHAGILLFNDFTRLHTFNWSRIRKLSFKRLKLILILHTSSQSSNGSTLEFALQSRNSCKLFWKHCIEHHAFFRRSNLALGRDLLLTSSGSLIGRSSGGGRPLLFHRLHRSISCGMPATSWSLPKTSGLAGSSNAASNGALKVASTSSGGVASSLTSNSNDLGSGTHCPHQHSHDDVRSDLSHPTSLKSEPINNSYTMQRSSMGTDSQSASRRVTHLLLRSSESSSEHMQLLRLSFNSLNGDSVEGDHSSKSRPPITTPTRHRCRPIPSGDDKTELYNRSRSTSSIERRSIGRCLFGSRSFVPRLYPPIQPVDSSELMLDQLLDRSDNPSDSLATSIYEYSIKHNLGIHDALESLVNPKPTVVDSPLHEPASIDCLSASDGSSSLIDLVPLPLAHDVNGLQSPLDKPIELLTESTSVGSLLLPTTSRRSNAETIEQGVEHRSFSISSPHIASCNQTDVFDDIDNKSPIISETNMVLAFTNEQFLINQSEDFFQVPAQYDAEKCNKYAEKSRKRSLPSIAPTDNASKRFQRTFSVALTSSNQEHVNVKSSTSSTQSIDNRLQSNDTAAAYMADTAAEVSSISSTGAHADCQPGSLIDCASLGALTSASIYDLEVDSPTGRHCRSLDCFDTNEPHSISAMGQVTLTPKLLETESTTFSRLSRPKSDPTIGRFANCYPKSPVLSDDDGRRIDHFSRARRTRLRVGANLKYQRRRHRHRVEKEQVSSSDSDAKEVGDSLLHLGGSMDYHFQMMKHTLESEKAFRRDLLFLHKYPAELAASLQCHSFSRWLRVRLLPLLKPLLDRQTGLVAALEAHLVAWEETSGDCITDASKKRHSSSQSQLTRQQQEMSSTNNNESTVNRAHSKSITDIGQQSIDKRANSLQSNRPRPSSVYLNYLDLLKHYESWMTNCSELIHEFYRLDSVDLPECEDKSGSTFDREDNKNDLASRNGERLDNGESPDSVKPSFVWTTIESLRQCRMPLLWYFLRPGRHFRKYCVLFSSLLASENSNKTDSADYEILFTKFVKTAQSCYPAYQYSESTGLLIEISRFVHPSDVLLGCSSGSNETSPPVSRPIALLHRIGWLKKYSKRGFQPRLMFAFNDRLVYASKIHGSSTLHLKIHGIISYTNLSVESDTHKNEQAIAKQARLNELSSNQRSIGQNVEVNLFSLVIASQHQQSSRAKVSKQRRRILFAAPNPGQCQAWIDQLTLLIDRHSSRRETDQSAAAGIFRLDAGQQKAGGSAEPSLSNRVTEQQIVGPAASVAFARLNLLTACWHRRLAVNTTDLLNVNDLHSLRAHLSRDEKFVLTDSVIANSQTDAKNNDHTNVGTSAVTSSSCTHPPRRPRTAQPISGFQLIHTPHNCYKCEMSGYLFRKFNQTNRWQKLWTVLADLRLTFYHRPSSNSVSSQPLASLNLLGYDLELNSSSRSAAAHLIAARRGSRRQTAFNGQLLVLSRHTKSYHFLAPTEQLLMAWYHSIAAVLRCTRSQTRAGKQESSRVELPSPRDSTELVYQCSSYAPNLNKAPTDDLVELETD